MSNRTDLQRQALEGAHYQIVGQIRDDNDNDVELDAIGVATMTLYDLESGDIINGVEDVDVKAGNPPVGRGYIDSDGRIRILLTDEDNVLLDDARDNEEHVALVKWTYAAGEKWSFQEYHFFVRRVMHG